MPALSSAPLIAHVVFRLDYGGLENGVVNVVNGLTAFRHTIISLTEASDFRSRIRRPDVAIHTLHKQPGKDPGAYVRLFKLLRSLRPDIVHTRNLSTLEGALVARLAGVPARIHGEHGWDVFDPDGTNKKYRAMRRLINPAIDRFICVSRELEQWLTSVVGIRAAKAQRICNGVDTEKFAPRAAGAVRPLTAERFPADAVIVGSVTRFSAIKNPLMLVRAFIAARKQPGGDKLRLLMAGDGELLAPAQAELRAAGEADAAWLPGSRDDVAELMREMDVFALSSLREGISNTVLESMASGLPVIASATGGNLELIVDGVTGRHVRPTIQEDWTAALLEYACNPAARESHGRRARERAVQEYSLKRMLADYAAVYRASARQTEEAA
jgi:sugar transferase (PEP-CTERM/EpsH1 system associated)